MTTTIRPHPGPQEEFLRNPADICIGGGQAGGGKTYALLLEPLRHKDVPGFSSVLFRRTSPLLTGEGGPWQESLTLYPHLGATASRLLWRWRSGARLAMRHMQYAKTRLEYKGWQIPLILWDQLEEFEGDQFWYLLSRNRSTCGVRPYVRATCNPVPEDDPVGGWLHRLLAWWIGDDGYPIPARAGRIRWFVRLENDLIWADDAATLQAMGQGQDLRPLSLSFVPMALEDNPTLQQKDPDYEARLNALPYVERLRLRRGNWKVRASSGTVFQRPWFKVLDAKPVGTHRTVRYWDCAATTMAEGGRARTAGAKVSVYEDGLVLIEHVACGHWSPAEVDAVIKQTAQSDGYGVPIFEEQEPGSSGKAVVQARAGKLPGWSYTPRAKRVDKLTAWAPLRSQAEAGNVALLSGTWVPGFLDEAESTDGVHGVNDQIDATAGAYVEIARQPVVGFQRAKLSGW